MEAEIEFFQQISSKVSGMPVPIFNDLSNCLSIADISVVTLEKGKFSFDFYEIKKTESGKFTPRHIKQIQRGEKITDFLQEGRGEDIGGFKNKIIYSTSVTAKYFYGDIQDLLYKCKKFGIAKRIKDKCIFYVAYDNSKYSFEQILEKYFVPYFKIAGSNGQLGSIETNIRDHFVKPIFLFEIDRKLILDLIFEKITLMVFFNYDYLNKLTKDRKISFLLDNNELFAFLKKDASKKFNVRGSNYSEIIHGGLSAISFVDYTEEVIPYFDDLMRGLPKDHPLSPYDPREKFGYKVVSGEIIRE